MGISILAKGQNLPDDSDCTDGCEQKLPYLKEKPTIALSSTKDCPAPFNGQKKQNMIIPDSY